MDMPNLPGNLCAFMGLIEWVYDFRFVLRCALFWRNNDPIIAHPQHRWQSKSAGKISPGASPQPITIVSADV
jgi:hypothetical protein